MTYVDFGPFICTQDFNLNCLHYRWSGKVGTDARRNRIRLHIRLVIRIFGIYTHTQLDKRFWEAVSVQLAGKGKEYRKRLVHVLHPPSHIPDPLI